VVGVAPAEAIALVQLLEIGLRDHRPQYTQAPSKNLSERSDLTHAGGGSVGV